MSVTAATFVSTSTRPLALRRRPDLIATRHTYLGRCYWVVKDPLALKYFRFEDEEFAILELLDGSTSLDQIQRQFEKTFAPQKITHAELHHLMGMLHRSSLVISERSGQGEKLFERHQRQRRQEFWAVFTNLLCLRFKGVDPDRFLTLLDRRCGWLFSCWALWGGVMFGGSALLWVLCHFEMFQARLPEFQQFFGASNWIYLAVVLGSTKVLHEFGHGLSCKHFGGECHEMGFMLLVGTPCLYCNVTDSWMLPNKWQRALIGAAGMYVELLLASLATYLWWFSAPGLLNHLCLNVMFVCSVSTIVFNANPLMRYDGYYILSDLLEIPNLRQKAMTVLLRQLQFWALGIPAPYDPFLPRRNNIAFANFALAAVVYRWLVAISVLMLLNRVLEPYGMKILGQLLAIGSVFGLIVYPLWQFGQYLSVPGRTEQMKQSHVITSSVALVALLLGIFCVPLPHRVHCSLMVQPRDAAAIYVDVPGSVHEIHVHPGEAVEQGAPVITLDPLDIQLALVRLEGERGQRGAKLESLRQRALGGEESATLEIAPLEESIIALDQQIAQRQQDLQRLVVKATTSGTIFPSPEVANAGLDSKLLPTWSGSPLHPKNKGAMFQSGVVLCRIGNPQKMEAVLAVSQDDIDFIGSGHTVEMVLDQLAGERFVGRIQHVAVDDMKTTPLSLSNKTGGDVVTRTDSTGRERPVSTTYQASVPFEVPNGMVFSGVTGHAKIHAAPRTIAFRVWRIVCQTFNFKM